LAFQTISAQTTAFVYQGSLKQGGNAANGNFDFEFALFDAVSGGTQTGATVAANSVAVSNGIFSASLDFGNLFPGANRFLEIRVRQTGGGAFTVLTPRQSVNSSPYSIKSLLSETTNNALFLGGIAANQYITTTGGGTNFIQNSTTQQTGNFNISGNGIIGGNVGIGTTSPQQKLHVDGNEIFSTGFGAGFKFRNRNSISSSDDWVWFSENNIARFRRVAASNDLIAVTADGNVGIGTSAPNQRLHVAGNGLFGGSLYATGNVGIGTTTPNYKLHVVGQNVRVESDTTGIFPRFSLNFTGGGVDAKKWQNYATADSLVFSALNDSEFFESPWMLVNRFPNTTAIQSVIFPEGNIGIGTNTPNDKLEVNGILRLSTLGSAGATTLCRNASNQISTCSSSLRYKTNISPFFEGLSFINQLHPISFDWKDGGMHDVGFGAEEVERINPLFVSYNDKGEVEGVKYDRLSVAFVNAFKEQQTQIESQARQINEQKDLIKKQQETLDALKQFICSQNSSAALCQ
jgi:hypothetical protein